MSQRDEDRVPIVTSASVDDYLKAILDLGESTERVTTSALAKRLAVTPASVTGMLRRLSAEDPPFVEYEKHRGVKLTDHGRLRALEVLRHHRLLERFLHDTLGYSWDEVHAEAERLEHAISETLEDRIAESLGDPEVDPHGHPIPRKDGSVPEREEAPLMSVRPGESAVLSRVSDEDPALLRYLAELGLRPGVRLAVEGRDPFDGPLVLRLAGARGPAFNLSRRVAAEMFVADVRVEHGNERNDA
jgi:DtxR family Mn-dependent transcriptional regulator